MSDKGQSPMPEKTGSAAGLKAGGTPALPHQSTTRKRRLTLMAGGLGMALLLAAVFTLGSLNTPFVP